MIPSEFRPEQRAPISDKSGARTIYLRTPNRVPTFFRESKFLGPRSGVNLLGINLFSATTLPTGGALVPGTCTFDKMRAYEIVVL